MRICFVQPSLETGRDGLADYVDRLSRELRASGHDCLSFVPRPDNVAEFKALLKEAPVDWLSLQWVPFGFHPKGLPQWLPGWIEEVGEFPPRRHWMFHELWLGLSEEDRFRYRWWGFKQRRLTQRLLRSWQPRCVHTQAGFYQKVLNFYDIEARRLALFGNVPIIAGAVSPVDAYRPYPEDEWVRIVHFGRVHPELDLEALAEDLRARLQLLDKKGIVFFSGRTLRKSGWLDACNERFGPELIFRETGAMERDELSRLFRQAHWGLSSTPWQLTDKSGSVAALVEHGLPVLVWRNDFVGRKRYGAAEDEFPHCFLAEQLAVADSAQLRRHPPQSRLAAVARQFIEDLKACAS
ncbi:MAG: hypothetical protein JJU20_05265 [Opitutales bacterium]|nr:hypothetical protein [Opitutales bacterium]